MAKVVTGKCRLSYPNLFKARSFNNGEPMYSAVLLIPKTDRATVTKIKDAVEEAVNDSLSTKFKGKRPGVLHSPLRDGDAEKADQAEYAGMYFMNVKSKNAPKLYDRDHNEIFDQEELYPGCWVRADLNFSAYSNSGNNGVGAYVNSVMKWKDGERLAGYTASADVYDDYEDDEDLM